MKTCSIRMQIFCTKTWHKYQIHLIPNSRGGGTISRYVQQVGRLINGNQSGRASNGCLTQRTTISWNFKRTLTLANTLRGINKYSTWFAVKSNEVYILIGIAGSCYIRTHNHNINCTNYLIVASRSFAYRPIYTLTHCLRPPSLSLNTLVSVWSFEAFLIELCMWFAFN